MIPTPKQTVNMKDIQCESKKITPEVMTFFSQTVENI